MIRRRTPGAFSTVELLVVVAIAVLLLSILLPALASVRASGRSAWCISNLRQMSIAAHQYAREYGFFPPAIRWHLDDGIVNMAWDWYTTGDGRLISPGPLWSFTDDPGRVQQCPSYQGPTNFGDPHTGYNYNTTYVGGEGRFMSRGWDDFRPGVRYGACRRTGRVALFGDGGVIGGVANKFMRAPMNTETVDSNLQIVYGGGQAFRHGHATNVAYLDLHSGSVSAPLPGGRATDALLEMLDYPRNGFLSNDDSAYDPR